MLIAAEIEGNHKIVTLDGNSIDYSGVISGGGKPKKGSMDLSELPQASNSGIEFETIEKDI
jgi:chromosome segregation ATPase